MIDGQERTKYDKIAPKSSQTLQIGIDTLATALAPNPYFPRKLALVS